MAHLTVDVPQEISVARSLTVRELAQRVAGDVEGDDRALILGVSSIEEAETGDVVFAENDRFLGRAQKSQASAIIAFLDATTPDKPLIKVDNPRHAFIKVLELFAPRLNVVPGIHPSAILGRESTISEGVSIGANAVIGDRVSIGARSAILPGCYVGDDSTIGEDCILYPNVTLYAHAVLGKRVRIHSGTVIGADGFGYVRVGDSIVKVPQVGNVEIEDDVEIGANVTIDRSKTGSTTIGARSKIDNLVHIAHNVKVGTDCVIVAQVGVAGSVQLGQGVTIAGQAGIKDHITVGDRATIMAKAGLWRDIKAGEIVSGDPARPHRERLRQDAAAANHTGYAKRIRLLEKQNAHLQARNDELAEMISALAERIGVAPSS